MDYCEDCYYERFDSCEFCGETYGRDELEWIDSSLTYEYCRDRRFEQCDGCYEYFRKGTLLSVVNLRFCEECYRDSYTEEV